MVGADPEFQIRDRADQAMCPDTPRHAQPRRWRWIAVASLFVPLSFVLVQCGKATSAGMLAANSQGATQATAGDSFEDRFPKPQFADRFPTASESLVQRQVALAPPQRKVRTEPVRVASLTPTLTLPQATEREELTTLVSMKSSAFPYFGTNPRSEAPFLNVSNGDRKGHLTGDPKSAQAFANMPIVIVGYSGGFLPTAWSLDVGGATNRVRGVFLLDAVYGELDKFASWIENNRSGFFVSSYTHYTKPRDRELIETLRDKGITVTENMDGPLRPGSVVFVQTPNGVTPRHYVTQAWTEHPVREVLVKMAASPSLARIAGAPAPAS